MRKKYTEAEMESQVRSATEELHRTLAREWAEDQKVIDAAWEEAVAQAFKDGLNRASEHIAAEMNDLPENYTISIRVSHVTTLYKATQVARGRAREIFGSSFHLAVDVEKIRALNPPVLFDFTVTAVRKERHA